MPVALSAPVFAQTPLEQATALQQQGRVDDAIVLLRRATETAPNDAAIRNALGALLNRSGQYPEALVHAEAAAALDAGNYRYRLNRGIVLNEHGRFASAIADFDFALARNPNLPYAYLERAAALLALDRDAEARTQYGLARKADAAIVWPDWYEAIDDFVNRRYQEAAERFDRVGIAEPGFGPAMVWRALARARAGMPAPVIEELTEDWSSQLHRFQRGDLALERLLAIARADQVTGDPRRVGQAWFVAAEKAVIAGHTAQAIEHYRKAVAVDAPRHAWKIAAERALRSLDRQ